MSTYKKFYVEITERIKKLKEWVKENDDRLEKSNKLIEKYEAQRRQNDETDDK